MYRKTAWLIATIQGSTNTVVDYGIFSEESPTQRLSPNDPYYLAIVLVGAGETFQEGIDDIRKQLTGANTHRNRYILSHPSFARWIVRRNEKE